MNTIVLFVESSNGWSPEEWIIKNEGVKTKTGQFILEVLDTWLSVHRNDQVFHDYDEVEKQYVFSFFKYPEAYLIEWKGETLLEKFIADVPSDSKAVIDNDHGLICLVEDIKSLTLSSWIKVNKL